MKLYNLTKNRVTINDLKIAKKYFERMKGLLGQKEIGENEGLLIEKCSCIHTFFMKFPIDVIFLRTQITQIKGTDYTDDTKKTIYKVVKILHNIKPWRLLLPVFGAVSILEIKAGSSAKNIIPPPVSTAKPATGGQTGGGIISVGDELKIAEER